MSETVANVDNSGRIPSLAAVGPWIAPALAILAITQQSLGHHNPDNSWLFTVAEKILDGARPYIDVYETNPPASFLLYMPAAVVARAIGASTEFVVSTAMFLGAGLCAYFAARILSRARLVAEHERDYLWAAVAFALLVLPGLSFAEREHVALIWVLPILAIHASRMAGAGHTWAQSLGAGLLAGLAMSIKPHFALAIMLSLACIVIARRSLSAVWGVENFVAAGIVVSYTLIAWTMFPAFLDAFPAIIDAYVSIRQHWEIMLTEPWFLLNLVMLAAAFLIGGPACLAPRVLPLLAASIGFTGAYLWQGKGWMNHELPAVGLLCLALAMLTAPMLEAARSEDVSDDWTRARPFILFAAFPAIIVAPVLFGAIVQWSGGEEHPGLTEAVRRHAPAHPRIMALSPQLSAGFPLTRRLDGVWVGRAQRLWLTVSARMLLAAGRGDEAYQARLRRYVTQDTSMFLADVRARHPDVILVDKDPRIADAIRDNPDLAASLEGYEPVATADDLEVWIRSRP